MTRRARLRIALSFEAPTPITVDDGVAAAVRRVASVCEQLGHEVVEATPPVAADELRAAVSLIMAVNVAAAKGLPEKLLGLRSWSE